MNMYGDKLVNAEAIGELIRDRRVAWGISQADLAFEANVSQTTVSAIERGKAPVVSFEALLRVSFALNFDVSDICILNFQPNKWWRDVK